MKHNEAYFKGYQDFKIYHQYWLPENHPKAILLVAHGFGEHSGRYLNREVFTTLTEAKVLIEQWGREYNQVRPHSALGYWPPAPEAILTMVTS